MEQLEELLEEIDEFEEWALLDSISIETFENPRHEILLRDSE